MTGSALPAAFGRVAVLSILLLLVLLELGLRYAEQHHSGDMDQLDQLGALALRMDRSEPGGVLFLGNSLTKAGVDVGGIRDGFKWLGARAPEIYLAHRNDTTIAEWPAFYRWLSQQTRNKPDWVVLGFARNQLLHSRSANPTILAVDYGDFGDLPYFATTELGSWDARLEYLVADHVRIVAHRFRVSRMLLRALIPGYGVQAAKWVSQAGVQESVSAVESAADTTLGWQRLQALAEQVHADGAALLLVAMPVRDAYPLPHAFAARLAERGIHFRDARGLGLQPQHFQDSHHLNAGGKRIYTDWLVGELRSLLEDGAKLDGDDPGG